MGTGYWVGSIFALGLVVWYVLLANPGLAVSFLLGFVSAQVGGIVGEVLGELLRREP